MKEERRQRPRRKGTNLAVKDCRLFRRKRKGDRYRRGSGTLIFETTEGGKGQPLERGLSQDEMHQMDKSACQGGEKGDFSSEVMNPLM